LELDRLRRSAVRIQEKIAKPEGDSPGYQGGITQLRLYLKSVRPKNQRVYQDAHYEPGEAMQIDWGDVGPLQIGNANRKVSVFVAVLCHSRMIYRHLAIDWRDNIANIRIHDRHGQKPIVRFEQEKLALRPLPRMGYSTDEMLLTEARSTAQIEFDCNRYSVPPKLARRTVTVVANADTIRILHEGVPVAEHRRSYGKRESIIDSQHRIDALQLRRRQNATDLEKNFGALGKEAREFQLALSKRPVRPAVHLKRIVALVNLYGRETVLQAMRLAIEYQTIDAAYVADNYREVLDEASRKNTTMLDVLMQLVSGQLAARRDGALSRRVRAAHLPPLKTLAEYDFTFPKKISKPKILRLFDLQFVDTFGCAVFLGGTGLGKTHLLTALGYAACEKGISVRFSRVVDMINSLTTAQQTGTLQKRLKEYVRPQLLLLDELGYLPIDKRGADLMFQIVASRYEAGSIVISTNRAFKDWGRIFDVDSTLATAMIDRLMHHGEAIVIQGDRSYRNPDKQDEE